METATEEEVEEEEDDDEASAKVPSSKSCMLQQTGQQQVKLTEDVFAEIAKFSTQLVTSLHGSSVIQQDALASLTGRLPSSVARNIPSSQLLLEAAADRAAFSRSMIVNHDQETSTKGPAVDKERARAWQHILEQRSSVGSIPISEANSKNTAMQTSLRREAVFTTRNDPVLSFDSTFHKEKSTKGPSDTKRSSSVLQKVLGKLKTGKEKLSVETVPNSIATPGNNRKRKLLGPGSGTCEPTESVTMKKKDPGSGSDQHKFSTREIYIVTSALDALVKEGSLESENAWRLMMAMRR